MVLLLIWIILLLEVEDCSSVVLACWSRLRQHCTPLNKRSESQKGASGYADVAGLSEFAQDFAE